MRAAIERLCLPFKAKYLPCFVALVYRKENRTVAVFFLRIKSLVRQAIGAACKPCKLSENHKLAYKHGEYGRRDFIILFCSLRVSAANVRVSLSQSGIVPRVASCVVRPCPLLVIAVFYCFRSIMPCPDRDQFYG